MLHTNDKDKVKNKLNSLKYTKQEASDIWLLIHMSRPVEVIKDLISFKKLQSNSKLTTSQVKQWSNINSKHILKLWNWKLSITSGDAKAKGWLGQGIDRYMRERRRVVSYFFLICFFLLALNFLYSDFNISLACFFSF